MFRLLYAVDETGDDGDDDGDDGDDGDDDGGDDDDDGGEGGMAGMRVCKGHCIFNIHCAPNIQPSNFSW